jgi:hypothetical protein
MILNSPLPQIILSCPLRWSFYIKKLAHDQGDKISCLRTHSEANRERRRNGTLAPCSCRRTYVRLLGLLRRGSQSQTMLRSSSGRGAYGGRSFVILFRPWPWTYFTGHSSHLLTSIATRRPAAGPNNCRTAATGELSVDSSFARKIDGLAELVNMKR